MREWNRIKVEDGPGARWQGEGEGEGEGRQGVGEEGHDGALTLTVGFARASRIVG